MSTQDYYQLLGVSRKADRRTIRKAYRRALLLHHPDANGGKREGEQTLQQVIAAGRILCDKQQRAHYDQQYAKNDQNLSNKESETSAAKRVGYQKHLLVGCLKILQSSKWIWGNFFSAEKARETDFRAAQQPKRKSPGFNFYLQRAMNRRAKNQYSCGLDGVYRKEAKQAQKAKSRTWQKRTAVWLLIGILLWRF